MRLNLPLDHLLLDLSDGFCRIEPLRAGLGAVHDGVTAVEPERIFQIVQPLARRLVAAVGDPAIGLQQDGRTQIAIATPPIARAAGGAAGTQNALPKTIELGALGHALALLALGLNIVVGYAGMLDLGYAAFFAIGAYSMGLLNSPVLHSPLYGYPWSFWVCIWFAAAVSALLGVVIGGLVVSMYLPIFKLGSVIG